VTAERASSALELVVDPTKREQTITGFGASSAWTGGDISASTADLFFTPDSGLGLSLLRMHIAPDGTTSETNTARLAVERGVKVWAAPWSPPGAWKTSGTDNLGGSLLTDYYQAWADRLTAFVVAQGQAGVPLFALSAQNEPNYTASWETCVYTPDQLVVFVRDYLAPAIARDCPGVKLLAPETIDWNSLSGFADPLLADPGAEAAIDVVAVHDYGGAPYAYAAPAANGKEFWETEVSYDDQAGILAALETAREIHLHLTTGGVNAFHYWWLVAGSGETGGLLVNDALTPQAYALGHFSKFVRPGYVRLDVPPEPDTGVHTSAYADPESDRIVIVAVNEQTTPVDLSLRFKGTAPSSVEPWLTTADVSLVAEPTVTVTNPLSYSLPPQSITTLVATGESTDSGAGGAGGAANVAGADAGGMAGEGGVGAPPGNGGSVSSHATGGSGGSGSARSGHGGTSSSHGGSTVTAGEGNDAGAGDILDGGVSDDAGTKHRVHGLYSACLCRMPGGSRGGGAEATPFVALLALAVGRRRSRHRAAPFETSS
jgi:glucuronoarabinoxylan endo-1,4-beta-xylanase